MLVHQLFDPGDVAVAVGRGHRRNQVVDDGGVGAPLGLGTLTRIIDYEWIEEGNVVQRHLGIASFGQTDALTGQPLQGAVLADMNHGVGLEDVADPTIIGDVMMGRSQVRAVVDGDGIFAEATGRLQADKDVAKVDARYGQASVAAIDLAWRLSPGFSHLLDYRGREVLEPFSILASGNVSRRHPELLFGERVPVVATSLDDTVDQLVAGFGDVGNVVASFFHGVKDPNHRCRCV